MKILLTMLTLTRVNMLTLTLEKPNSQTFEEINKLGWECHTRDLRSKIQDNALIVNTPKTQSGVYSTRKIHIWLVAGHI